MRRRSLKSAILTIILVLVLILAIRWFGDPLPAELKGLAKAVDGDSLVLDGHRLRLVGLDAPEYTQVCSQDGRDVACGEMARLALDGLVKARAIECRMEGEDRYNRLLARCYDGNHDIVRYSLPPVGRSPRTIIIPLKRPRGLRKRGFGRWNSSIRRIGAIRPAGPVTAAGSGRGSDFHAGADVSQN